MDYFALVVPVLYVAADPNGAGRDALVMPPQRNPPWASLNA